MSLRVNNLEVSSSVEAGICDEEQLLCVVNSLLTLINLKSNSETDVW